MELENAEFKLILEMIIISRNENGATLSEIRDDYHNVFKKTFESMFGPDWNVCLSNLLLNKMDDVSTRQLDGCTLYFTNKEKFREKLLPLRNNENIQRILYQLNIDPENIKPYNNKGKYSFSSIGLNSTSWRSNSSSRSLNMVEFYNHTLIADNFLLELSHIDLKLEKSKNNEIECIGLCISGQTLKSAYHTITNNSYNFKTKNVIVNIGTFDLLNGRTAVNIIADIVRLLNALKRENINPILTTLAPILDSVGDLDDKRQSFNKFIRENFEFIDIEACFLSTGKRVLEECYQPIAKTVGGSRHAIRLWNRVGRQRVLQLMKREIPYIHPIF